jgi:DNA-binding PadR family transcriptional regulator
MGNLSPEFALLGLLTSGPSHGYGLHQKLQVDLGNVWRVSQSQAYAILKRLENHGDVSVKPRTRDKQPARHIVHITNSGEKRFKAWLFSSSHNARAIRLELLTRLYFTQYNTDQAARIYAVQYSEIRDGISQLECMLEQTPPEQIFNSLSLELRIRQLRLIQGWMGEIREIFKIPGEISG